MKDLPKVGSIADVLDSWETEGSKPIQFRDGITAHDGIKITEMNQRILLLISALRVQEEALKFYSDEKHFVSDYKYDEGFSVVADEYAPLSCEDGLKAREALANAERILKG